MGSRRFWKLSLSEAEISEVGRHWLLVSWCPLPNPLLCIFSLFSRILATLVCISLPPGLHRQKHVFSPLKRHVVFMAKETVLGKSFPNTEALACGPAAAGVVTALHCDLCRPGTSPPSWSQREGPPLPMCGHAELWLPPCAWLSASHLLGGLLPLSLAL